FAMWVELLSDQGLDWRYPFESSLTGVRLLRHHYWAHPARGRYELLSPRAITLHSVGGPDAGISRADWSRCLRAANRSLQPPDIWTLMRDSRNALRRKAFRRSVLDSATAAELAITMVLREH